jgi:hypothetical protein
MGTATFCGAAPLLRCRRQVTAPRAARPSLDAMPRLDGDDIVQQGRDIEAIGKRMGMTAAKM